MYYCILVQVMRGNSNTSTTNDVYYHAPATSKRTTRVSLTLRSMPKVRTYLSELSPAERATLLASASAPLPEAGREQKHASTTDRLLDHFDFRPGPPPPCPHVFDMATSPAHAQLHLPTLLCMSRVSSTRLFADMWCAPQRDIPQAHWREQGRGL